MSCIALGPSELRADVIYTSLTDQRFKVQFGSDAAGRPVVHLVGEQVEDQMLTGWLLTQTTIHVNKTILSDN